MLVPFAVKEVSDRNFFGYLTDYSLAFACFIKAVDEVIERFAVILKSIMACSGVSELDL